MLSLESMDDVDVNEDFVNTEATMSTTSTLNVTAELQSKRLWKCKLLGIIGCPQNIIVQNETELSEYKLLLLLMRFASSVIYKCTAVL